MKGSIRKRGKTSWELTIDLGHDAEGKRVRKFVTVQAKKKSDAEAKLRELLTRHDQGLPFDNSKILVAEFLDRWLTDYAVVNTRPRTAEGYAGILRRYLKPALGHLLLSKLQPQDIQAMEARLLERGLSPRTIQHTHRVLHEALKYATKWGLLFRNPAEAVDPPRVVKKEPITPSAGAVQELLDLARQTPWYALFCFAAYTGCRRSEILGVRWEDIDFDRGTVSIVQTTHRVTGKGIIIQPPKSAKGRRSIALDAATVAVLRAHRTKQLAHRLQLGDAYEDNGLVFAGPFGKPQEPACVTRPFRRMADQVGLQGVRLHDLRHFHATTLLKTGTHPKVVQERLGHATISTTLDTYSHVVPGLQEQAAKSFAEAMEAAKKSV